MTDRQQRDAGRELDAEVAERVFGWRWYAWREGTHLHLGEMAGRKFLLTPSFVAGFDAWGTNPYRDATDADVAWPATDAERAQVTTESLPRYSTDIAAAFQVVARMREVGPTRFKNLWLVAYCYNRTYATFDAEKGISGEDWTEANGEHATPLAICLAALDALEPSPTISAVSPFPPSTDNTP